MNRILNAIFGLGGPGGASGAGGVGFGSEGASFSLTWVIPGWAWALIVVAAGLAAWWCYWRIAGPRSSRLALGCTRGLLIVLVLFLAAGPRLMRSNERVERDWIAMLVDRSASLGVADVPRPDASGATETRDAQALRALADASPSLAALEDQRNLLWLGFDAGVFDVEPGVLGEADGPGTRIDVALDRTLARLAAEPISSIVLLSDGRSGGAIDRGVVRALRAQRVPVFPVPLGSPEPVGDWSVERIDAPAAAFLDDVVPVRVRLDRRGAAGGARVELVERRTGLVLDSVAVDEGGEATLTHRAGEAGDSEWFVRVLPEGRDLIEANNERSMSIELIDRPLRVAYFDGYPRWEQRYVKNLLLRESSIESASLLLATDRAYIQEGAITIDALPRSPEDWARFDVVVLGDVGPDVFSETQLLALRDHVATRGAGLLWIAGPGATPTAWAGTPLADLLPFTRAPAVAAAIEPVVMRRAEAAARLGLLALDDSADGGWPARLEDAASGFSRLQYAQRIDVDSVKPAAEVLATFEGMGGGVGPAVLSMRFGAGKVVYVATDETWRWRYALGEVLQERFWLPLLRHLGRASATRAGRAFELTVSPREATPGRPVRLSLELLDQALIDAAPRRVAVRVRSGAREEAALELAPEPGSGRGEGAVFSATWTAPEPGDYVIEAAGLGLATAATLRVRPDDDELRNPDADHALLAQLAEETGGRVLAPEDLSRLGEIAPNRERRTEAPPDVATLWDTPAAMLAVLLLAAAEWVGRRLIRLV